MVTLAEAVIEFALDEQYRVDHAVSGAIIDFLGYLTCHDGTIEVGRYSEVPPLMELFLEWAKTRGLSIDDADVMHWEHVLGRGLSQ